MSDRTTNLNKISEALQLLDEVAVQEKESFQDLLKNRYQHLKEAMVAAEHSMGDSISQSKDKAYARAVLARDYSVEKAKMLDASVHEKPWLYLAGAAVFGLLSGYILGRNSGR